MALTTSTITGRVPLPDDANPTAAEIVFVLSGYDTEGSQVIPGGAKARFVLDHGDMPAGAKLWRNTEGLRGTVYAVEVAWSEAGRRETLRRTASLGVVQVGDDASYTLGELLDATPVPAPDNTYWRSITQQQYDDMMAARDEAEAAAASVMANRHDLRMFGAVSPGDLSDPVQAAYDAASDGDTIVIPPGAWTCADALTLDGDKRVTIVKMPGADFTSDADLARAMPEQANGTTGRKWEEVEQKTAFVDGSGGAKLITGRLDGTGTDAAGQRDFLRIEVNSRSSSEGPSWDGVGPVNINRDQVALGVFNFGTTGQMYQAIWGINAYAYLPAGSDGAAMGIEANIHLDGQAAVKEMGVFSKYGVLSVSKDDAATAAYAVGGLFYKGVVLQQTSLPNDAASRAFEYTDLFEVMRDGRVLVGKGVSNLFGAGAEIGPTGEFYITGNAGPAQPFYARSDILSGAGNIRAEQDRARSAAGTQRVFAQKIVSCQTATDAAETGRIEWQTVVAGALATRMFLQQGLSINGGAQLVRNLRATATLDFPSVPAQSASSALTVTVTGAVVGDHVTVTPPAANAAQGVVYDGVVTGANTVSVYAKNLTTGAIDPASGTFSVHVSGWA